MKVNTMIVAVVAAASGGIGFGVARLSQSHRVPRATAPASRGTGLHHMAAELAIARDEAHRLRERLDRDLARVPRHPGAAPDAAPPTVAERVQRIAQELKVSPAVLEIAIRAERMVREKRKGADKAVRELAAHEETGGDDA